MDEVVIDTNVLLVANGNHADVSPACVTSCVKRLTQARENAVIVVDNGYRILSEYRKKLDPNGAKGVGGAFLKWLLQQQDNPCRVHQVALTDHGEDQFNEFPDPALETAFDPPDRKFAAVAHAHPSKPPVWQAADCKWLSWWQALAQAGVRVEFLCPVDVCAFYAKKFPGHMVPPLP